MYTLDSMLRDGYRSFFWLKYQGNFVQKTECSLKCEKLYLYNIVMEIKNGLVLLKNGEICLLYFFFLIILFTQVDNVKM